MRILYKVLAKGYAYSRKKFPRLYDTRLMGALQEKLRLKLPHVFEELKISAVKINSKSAKRRVKIPDDAKPAVSEFSDLSRKAFQLKHTMQMMMDRDPNLSIMAGNAHWREKWQSCKGKRILFFAYVDYSASFYKWAEAVNTYTPHAVRMVSLKLHRYGYPVDILYPKDNLLTDDFVASYDAFLTLIDEADIIHIKDQTGFWDGGNGLPSHIFKQFQKPILYTLYGGKSRQDQFKSAFQEHVKSFDAVVSMTPDLCFDWLDSEFIPHSIDATESAFSWEDKPLVVHTPSTPSRKGTELFEEACVQLKKSHDIEYKIVTGVSHEAALAEKKQAALFFDQAGRERAALGGHYIGWYGNSALEAAVHGIPTMAYMSDEAFERAARAGRDIQAQCGMLNVQPNADSIREVMQNFFESTPSQRAQIAQNTRAWIEEFHSQQAVADMLSKLYERF